MAGPQHEEWSGGACGRGATDPRSRKQMPCIFGLGSLKQEAQTKLPIAE